ncbi:MAG: polysaccharide deacetylase family protein, partial [Lachnospiraceae bacterium]|nr:polysaccharide deacetylase family protein [Lachnospiraceae bacterium]
GAGTDKAKLKVDGKDFSLTLNNRVEITGVEGDWFHILVDAGGTSYEGYAYGPYITPDAGSGYTAIARPGSTVINITSEKYKDYDNILREWWYTRNTTHTIPGPGYANDISSLFPEYGTYYANTKVSPDDKVMYLTFDAGYENGYTEKILDTLKKHNAKACFFVTTGFVKEAPSIAKRMKEEGHLVGNHTKNHPSLPTRTDEQVMAELTSVEETFKEKTGYTLDPFMRPPQGDFSQRTLKIQQDMGYKTILWSLAIPNDWDTSKQDQVDSFGRFKADHHSGCIALIHSVSKANAEALDKILTFLEDEGYRFGMLTELD